MNLTKSMAEARLDLDTRPRMSPTNPTGLPKGPDRYFYWVESIAWNHERAHIYNFYANWWQPAMEVFERIDVEGTGVAVVFDCTNRATTTGSAAIASKTSDWDGQVSRRHTTAYDQHAPTAEVSPHDYKSAIRADFRGAREVEPRDRTNKRREVALLSPGIGAA